jgi:hypothetical protein
MNSATSSDKEAELQKPSKSAARLKLVREWHLYLGTLFAPSIFFFALTGALRLFGLHEGHPGEAYQPPGWVQKLGSIHKNQTVSERRGPPPGFAGEQKRPPESDEARRPVHPEGGRRIEERGTKRAHAGSEMFLSGDGGWVGLLYSAGHFYGAQIQPKPGAGLEHAVNRFGHSGWASGNDG